MKYGTVAFVLQPSGTSVAFSDAGDFTETGEASSMSFAMFGDCFEDARASAASKVIC